MFESEKIFRQLNATGRIELILTVEKLDDNTSERGTETLFLFHETYKPLQVQISVGRKQLSPQEKY